MNIVSLPISYTKPEEYTIELFYGHFHHFIKNVQYLNSLLSKQELARAEKFVFEKDKLMYIVSHGLLRIILANKTNTLPHSIEYSYNTHEKPYVKIPDCHFNLSHTSDFFAIAFSNKNNVGVDVEKFDRTLDWKNIAKLYFSENEIQLIHSTELSDQLKQFIAFWTRKEAILKVVGCGMVNNLKDIDSSKEIFMHNNIFTNITDLQELSIEYHIQTFSTNEIIISISYPTEFSVKTKELIDLTL
jgi:phosphopantetheinyl transferase